MACGIWCLNGSRPRPPSRQGVGASVVFTPPGPWATAVDFFSARFTRIPANEWQQRLAQGDVLDAQGTPLRSDSPYQAGQHWYYFRAVATEPRIPFEATVLWQDEHLLVADKPHFLPVVPSGHYLQETLLVRLKNQLDLPDLAPLRRMDRDTAGLVLFSKTPASRGAYHALFRDHAMRKTYEAIAPWDATLPWPVHRATRIQPSAHFMQQAEVEVDSGSPVNAITDIAPLEVGTRLARYALSPITGQRHQLRVHMAALGLPLVGDGIYPHLTPEGTADYARPLQLLAKSIAFDDPLTGQPRHFDSQRSLRSLAELEAEL
ncbi:MAG: pseudouridine synthase [Burkholderiales bacterium PBB5]|nr:MAG: pseudouridine synthase [Burkholderiales bacterium PBB5]